MSDRFGAIAKTVSRWTGRQSTFLLAVMLIVVWLVSGPIFDFSDTWQLVINTGTTIVTFLMVFLIQNTQNRDTAAIQLKLDELIHATRGAHDELMDMEDREEDQLERLRHHYEQLAEAARAKGRGRTAQTVSE